MLLQVIATGSAGNCYALHDGESILLLDAGIEAMKILAAIQYRVQHVAGCLITHAHQDHGKGVKRLTDVGIRCFGQKGACEALPGLAEVIDSPIRLGPFRALCVPVEHISNDFSPIATCGWLITNSRTGERMVYITDTCAIRRRLPGLDYWLIECNYMDELLDDTTPEIVRERLGKSHMSLRKLCQVLAVNDLAPCKQIVLCHASRQRLDPATAERTVLEQTGKTAIVARADMRIPLEREPF